MFILISLCNTFKYIIKHKISVSIQIHLILNIKMKITIRKEQADDHKEVFDLIQEAFEMEEYSDHKEGYLVERLRKSDAFIPDLSLVATINKRIIGHILLTRIHIHNEKENFDSLALAPVSVLPAYQNKGIGSLLIKEAHRKAKELGHHSIVLLGHPDYYPRFGYEMAYKRNISLPFEVPKENCMVISLSENGLDGVSGLVKYPSAFFE